MNTDVMILAVLGLPYAALVTWICATVFYSVKRDYNKRIIAEYLGKEESANG